MYLKKLRLRNIKCFEDVTLEFPNRDGDYSGWVVLLGQNGAGKSSVLQAVGGLLAQSKRPPHWLCGPRWIRQGEFESHLDIAFLISEAEANANIWEFRLGFSEPTTCGPERIGTGGHRTSHSNVTFQRSKNQYSQGSWFFAGYGPYRRLSEGRVSSTSSPVIKQFLTLFDEVEGLPECIDWLPKLYSHSIDTKRKGWQKARKDLPVLIDLVNSLLPKTVRVDDCDSEQVSFRSLGATGLTIWELSDGVRSFLAVTLDLLRRAHQSQPDITALVREDEHGSSLMIEGMVLIDEADAHLHPSWQRELGESLCRVFPKIQFIVTTHSPFIAQSATDGGLFVLRSSEKGTVEVEKFEESVRGWTATQILTSPAFGLHSTRSIETEQLIRRNSDLVSKSRIEPLTKAEKRELKQIQEILESQLSAPGETYDQMNRQQEIQQYVAESLRRLNNGKS